MLQASSDGGLNIEPEAWENKDPKRGGRPVSRFPAQARFAAHGCDFVCGRVGRLGDGGDEQDGGWRMNGHGEFGDECGVGWWGGRTVWGQLIRCV